MSIITDVATLVKAGFTIEDIKEIVKADKAPAGDTIPGKEKEKESDPEPDKKDPDPEPDYKALYEKSQEDLKKAQAANTKENIEQPPVDREELFKSIKNRL